MKDYFISCYLAAMLELSCLTGGVPHPQLGGKGTGAFKNPLQAAYLIQTLAYLKAAQDLGIKEQKLIFKPYGGKVKTAFDFNKKKWNSVVKKLDLSNFSAKDFCNKLGTLYFQK